MFITFILFLIWDSSGTIRAFNFVIDPFVIGGLCFTLQSITSAYFMQAFTWISLQTLTFQTKYFPNNGYGNIHNFYFLTLNTFTAGLGIFGLTNLILIYLIFEVLSLGFAIMVAHNNKDSRVSISAFRYYTFSSVASCCYIYGLSMIYAVLDSVDLNSVYDLRLNLSALDGNNFYLYNVGVILIFCALCTKVGLAPFHNWMPMAYAYSRNIVTLFFMLIPKIPFFYLLYIFSGLVLPYFFYIPLLASLIIGTVFAYYCTDYKLFVVYSSIATNAFLLAPVGYSLKAVEAFIFYLYVYNALLFSVLVPLIFLKRYDNTFAFTSLRDLVSLKKTNIALGLILLTSFLSIAGVPPFAGFFAKLNVLNVSLSYGNYFITFMLLWASIFASYYYLRVIKLIMFPPVLTYSGIDFAISRNMSYVLIGLVVFNLFYIILPNFLPSVISIML